MANSTNNVSLAASHLHLTVITTGRLANYTTNKALQTALDEQQQHPRLQELAEIHLYVLGIQYRTSKVSALLLWVFNHCPLPGKLTIYLSLGEGVNGQKRPLQALVLFKDTTEVRWLAPLT